jgi:competence protein ComGC
MNNSNENLITKIKKLIEKHGWTIILLLIVLFIISIILFIQEKSREKE